MTTSRYDTIVIGAGQAGPGLALALAERGERVALVEADRLGGTCLNSGCRPSKALIASARAAHVARSSGHLGVRTDAVRVDLAAIVARKDALVGGWRDGYADLLGAHDNIDYIEARATFTGTSEEGHHLVAAADQTLGAPRVVINSGARSVPPPIPGLETVAWLDHHGILDLTELPEHLVVLGGSYMGLEFAQAFARLGSEVTVIDLAERIVVGEDPEISEAIAAFLTDECLEIHTGTAIDRVSSNGRGIALELTGGATKQASHLLIAAGRVPNSEALGLDTVGVETGERGYITTDEVFATNVEGIYAIGDVNGRGAFTHTSYQDYEILADHLAGGTRTVADRTMTYALTTDPPLGRVGLTESQAAAAGLSYSVASFPMDRVTRAALDGETDGLIKLIVDDRTGCFLGAAVLGPHGAEIIQTISVLMHVGAPASVLSTWLPIHPTVAEFLPTVAARAA